MIIGVSGMNATDNPGPGIPVARSLREAKVAKRIIGLSYDAHDPGNYMDFVIDAAYRLPYPTKGWSALNDSLQRIQNENAINAIIPCLDVELPLYIKHQDSLQQLGIKTFLPTEQQFALRSKEKLIKLCQEIEVSYPHTILVNSLDELASLGKEQVEWPMFVKGRFYKAYLAYTPETAAQKFIEISNEWGVPILLQEPISGVEINLVGLGDGEGELCGIVAIKKLMTTSLGKIWTGVTIEHPELISIAQRFVKHTKWRGPFELECIQNGPEISLIEINPRFPAWVYFATAVGINLPARLIDLMKGNDCDRNSNYPVGKYFVRYTSEIVTDMEKYFKLASSI